MGVLEASGVSESHIAAGLTKVCWPGRLELFPRENRADVLFDGAHNLAAMRSLLAFVEKNVLDSYERVVFLVSILERKNWVGICEELKAFIRAHANCSVVYTTSRKANAVSPDILCENTPGATGEEDPLRAFGNAEKEDNRTLVVVCGSLYLVGELRQQASVP